MFEFLEECPLGYESEVLMCEAADINASRASLALNSWYALDNIRQRRSNLNVQKHSASFNDMVSFYEEENEKNSQQNEQKKGLIAKAWGAICGLGRRIKEFFQKLGKPKGGDETVEIPEGTSTAINLIAAFGAAIKEVIFQYKAVAIPTALAAAKKAKDFVVNEWEKKNGKTESHKRDEALALVAKCDEAIDFWLSVAEKASDAESKLAAENNAAAAADAKGTASKEAEEADSKTAWGKIRSFFQWALNGIKSIRTKIFNILTGKSEESSNDTAEGNPDKQNGGKPESETQNDPDKGKSDTGNADSDNGKKNDSSGDDKSDNGKDNNAEKDNDTKSGENKNQSGSGDSKSGDNKPDSEKKEGFFSRLVNGVRKIYKRDKDGNEVEVPEDQVTEESVIDESEYEFDMILEELDVALTGDGNNTNSIAEEESGSDYNFDEDAEDWEADLDAMYESVVSGM